MMILSSTLKYTFFLAFVTALTCTGPCSAEISSHRYVRLKYQYLGSFTTGVKIKQFLICVNMVDTDWSYILRFFHILPHAVTNIANSWLTEISCGSLVRQNCQKCNAFSYEIVAAKCQIGNWTLGMSPRTQVKQE